jgi:hypothetical protein
MVSVTVDIIKESWGYAEVPPGLHDGQVPIAEPFLLSSPLLAAEFLYLSVHLIQCAAEHILQPGSPMVGQVAREHSRLFQEHAHVAQFGELRLCYMADVSHGTSPIL